MNIVVLGAGALGAYFGARLQEAGQNVTYLVRSIRAQQLKNNGLKIHSVKGDYTVEHLHAVESTAEIEQADLVLLAVKGYHLQGTFPQLKQLVDKGAKVLPVLNGIEHFELLQQQLGKENVIGGLSFIIATLNEAGHVVHTSDQHNLVFGPLTPSQEPFCNQLKQMTDKANINNHLSDHILFDLWKKYMFITAFSGITTAGNFPIGEAVKHASTFTIVKQALNEMKSLANAYQIPLTDHEVTTAIEQIKGFTPESTSSMHQDKRKGLTLEVEHLQGGAIRLAEKVNRRLPVVETLYGLIKPYENNSLS